MSDIKISLAAARVNAGLTQVEAAKALNVGNKTLNGWENGKITPRAIQLVALSDLYKIPIDNISLPTESA